MSDNNKKAQKEALNNFKMEIAKEMGIDLKPGYNGHLSAQQTGSVGGRMVKKMIEDYEKTLKK